MMKKSITLFLLSVFFLTNLCPPVCPEQISPKSSLAPPSYHKQQREARKKHRKTPIQLEDGARIAVVGGGPAGAFFAIQILRKAKALGKRVHVQILEKNREMPFYKTIYSAAHREGCNYCAGIISPRMSQIMEELGLQMPEEILQGKVKSITVQGHWKNMELKIPENRQMYLVFRGPRPRSRTDKRVFNFDSFLLQEAIKEGVEVVTGEVDDVNYTETDKTSVSFKTERGPSGKRESMEADFVVFAGGVNQIPGQSLAGNKLFQSIQKLLPGFTLPEVRKGLIFELEVGEEFARTMQGEVHFIEYGSPEVKIELCSIIPKGKYVTVALIGPSVDESIPSERMALINNFLKLPHIRKILPKNVKLASVCACSPNMTIGSAGNPYGDRAAIVGDMAASRLYKDGILSAYLTSTALADAMLNDGIDRESLKKGYMPEIERISTDNLYGKLIFLLNRITFSKPILSRMLYHAILTERRTKPANERRLENILWKVASGDAEYRDIFFSMIHPVTIQLILFGGVFVTIRNYLTELVLGLDWRGFGRYPTGVYREDMETERQRLGDVLGLDLLSQEPDFEKMYSIRIKAPKEEIFSELGKFGDDDRKYLNPNLIRIHRTSGAANETGSVIQYDIPIKNLSTSMVLEDIVQDRYLIYRVREGFAKGGVLIFDVNETGPRESALTIYVAFDYPEKRNPVIRMFWRFFRWLFPDFVHDVAWNHALCKIKDIIETRVKTAEQLLPPAPPTLSSDIINEYAGSVGMTGAMQ